MLAAELLGETVVVRAVHTGAGFLQEAVVDVCGARVMAAVECCADDELIVRHTGVVEQLDDVARVRIARIAAAGTEGGVVAGLMREAVAHVVGHELHVIDNLGDLVHFGVFREIITCADSGGDDAVHAKGVAQSLQELCVVLFIARVTVNLGLVAARVFPVDIDAIEVILLHGFAARLRKCAAAFFGTGHEGEAARAPATDGKHHAQSGVPIAELRDEIEMCHLVQIQKAVFADETERKVHVGELLHVFACNFRQTVVDGVADRIILHENSSEKLIGKRFSFLIIPLFFRSR